MLHLIEVGHLDEDTASDLRVRGLGQDEPRLADWQVNSWPGHLERQGVDVADGLAMSTLTLADQPKNSCPTLEALLLVYVRRRALATAVTRVATTG